MRVNRLTAAVVTASSLGAVLITGAVTPALAAAPVSRTAPAVGADSVAALRTYQDVRALYAAVNELTSRTTAGTADAQDRATVRTALDRVLADPEPPTPDPAAADTAAEAVKPTKVPPTPSPTLAHAKDLLKASVEALLNATDKGDWKVATSALLEVSSQAVNVLLGVNIEAVLKQLGDLLSWDKLLPKLLGLPELPKVPDVTGMLPKLPELPKLPAVPGLPALPSVPWLPSVPAAPAAAIPGLPIPSTAIPGFPKLW